MFLLGIYYLEADKGKSIQQKVELRLIIVGNKRHEKSSKTSKLSNTNWSYIFQAHFLPSVNKKLGGGEVGSRLGPRYLTSFNLSGLNGDMGDRGRYEDNHSRPLKR